MPDYNKNLAACPFCSGDAGVGAVWRSEFDILPKGYYAGCRKCGAQTGVKKTKEEAIQAWNTRKEESHER